MIIRLTMTMAGLESKELQLIAIASMPTPARAIEPTLWDKMLRFFILISCFHVGRSMAPPHPDFHNFESVHQMRRRLNITYNYQTKHLHSEFCRHISESLCRYHDESVGTERQRRRNLMENGQRHLNPNTGTFQGLALLVRFPEHAKKDLSPLSYIEEMFNGRGNSSVNPVGSLSDYYYFNTLDQLRINWTVIDWDTAPQSEKYYSGGVGGKQGPEIMQELFTWKLDKLDAEGFDFTPFDSDGDYIFDHVAVLHSGIAAEMGDIPCSQNHMERVWSQGSANNSAGWLSSSYYSLGGFAIGSAIGVVGNCQGDPYWDMGILAHELGHTHMLIDVYDDDPAEGYIKIGGLANHDIMANAYGWNRNPYFPSHMSPYSRELAGWLTPIEITKNGLYAMQAAQISGSVYRIRSGFPAGEYLLLENRQIIKWDCDRPDGAAGIIIFHVDEKADGFKQRSWPGKTGWPTEHYMVHVLQADGKYDIEQGKNLGDKGDFWVNNMTLGPTDSWPNTDAYQGGNRLKTGIKITIMSDPGFIMLFKVEGLADGGFAPSLVDVDPIAAGDKMNSSSGMENQTGSQPNSTGATLTWVLSLLAGVASMLGVALFFFM